LALPAVACAPGVELYSLLIEASTLVSIYWRLLAASVGVLAVLQAASELARAMAVSEKKVRRFMRLSSTEARQI